MMSDYISREALLRDIDQLYFKGKLTLKETIAAQPAADVRPVDEIEAAVDEALRVLGEMHPRMAYSDYSSLHNAIGAICEADMGEEATQ